MGERRPPGEKEFSPLDDTLGLISSVLSGGGENTAQKIELPSAPVPAPIIPSEEKRPLEPERLSAPEPKRVATVKQLPAKLEGLKVRDPEPEQERAVEDDKEEFVTLKFKVARSDYAQAKKILAALEEELRARIDISNLGRGWITRLITAEKEILDAARNQEKLKTPNSRNPLEVAEVDHAMTIIQSVAFRRAEPVR